MKMKIKWEKTIKYWRWPKGNFIDVAKLDTIKWLRYLCYLFNILYLYIIRGKLARCADKFKNWFRFIFSFFFGQRFIFSSKASQMLLLLELHEDVIQIKRCHLQKI